MNSYHWENERTMRNALIQKIGEGQNVKTIIVDKGHRNGPEIHKLSDTGIITIYNQYTGKLITKLIARPGQVRRFYKADEVIPFALLDIARIHQYMAYNYK